MIIKHALPFFIPTEPSYSLYCVLGSQPFQQQIIADALLSRWQQQYPEEEREKLVVHMQENADWQTLQHTLHSGSLFFSYRFIDVRLDKNKMPSQSKACWEKYLQAIDSNCQVLLRAPLLPQTELAFLSSYTNACIIQTYPPSPASVQQWIIKELQQITPQYEKALPSFLYQCYQGNLFALQQFFIRLPLLVEKGEPLSLAKAQEDISDQSQFPLYALPSTCLSGKEVEAVALIRKALANKTDATLLLYILTQEIRLLLQLQQGVHQGIPFTHVAKKLKIWPSRITMYQAALKKYSKAFLHHALLFAHKLDKTIKSNQSPYSHFALESLALSLCSGKEIFL